MTDSIRLTTALSDRYRVERELGQGGMATVYLAQDLRHHRKVALKVLRPELAAVIGAERFLHEITTTANLQHPHILALHDSGSVDGTVFYVMPFVEGESLRDRLSREKQLPVDDAVRIAREVASALDYAHRHGVIHRDIKPENILLHEGQALVADFGIALAAAKTGDSRMTETGMSLGTPTYMSPEQAMGERTLDARTDVYALGCVLYEMLTGEPPFTGPTAQSIVAKVMTESPRPVRSLRHTVPLHVNAAVARALEKLPADRFASAAELAQALGDPAFRTVAPPVMETAPTGVGRSPLVYGVAVLMLLLAVLAAWGWLRPVAAPQVTRFTATMDAADFSTDPPAISPDGRSFVYTNSRNSLSLRRADQLRGTTIAGGDIAWAPFFSPDGTGMGFGTGFPGDLRILTLSTGSIVTVAKDSVASDGATWSDDGWIYYTAGTPRALHRVRPIGGAPELVVRADTAREELFFRWPHALPGGRAVLLTIWYRRQPPAIAMVDVRNHETRILTQGVRAWFTPTRHLVVVRSDGSIAAARFNSGSGEVEGQLVELVPKGGVWVAYGGVAMMALSQSGTLTYIPPIAANRVVRVSRSGIATPVDPAWQAEITSLSLSPEGSRVAVSTVVEGRGEIWVKQLDAGPFTRLWALGSQGYRPFWSSDGKWIGFSSDASGIMALYRTAADGGESAERMTLTSRSVDEGQWSRDGRWLVFRAGSGGGRDILGLRPGIDSTPVPLVATEAEEYSPTLSPDGRWLAYGSNASGRDEIYVRPFPATSSGRVQVSLAGGTEPLWSSSGRELFYRDDARDLIAATLAAGPEFRVQSRRALFSVESYRTDARNRAYTVSPDDSWFLFAEQTASQVNQLVVVQNWIEELKARVGR